MTGRLAWRRERGWPSSGGSFGQERLRPVDGERSEHWRILLAAAVSSHVESLIELDRLDRSEAPIKHMRLLDSSALYLWRGDLFAVLREGAGEGYDAVLVAERGEGDVMVWADDPPKVDVEAMLGAEPSDDMDDINGNDRPIVLPRPGKRDRSPE